ncbi:MAG: serine/threonine protein kinase [Planctomycetes bacterium]|nr:serine/threonine protein kinase [Planctomycetota bacterium]
MSSDGESAPADEEPQEEAGAAPLLGEVSDDDAGPIDLGDSADADSAEGPAFAWSVDLPPEEEPKQIGPFLIGEVLGRGGQGKVYRAEDTRSQREVALKVLIRASEKARARFRREGEATAALSHPGIVRIHEAGEDEGFVYVAYELIEGAHSLKELLGGSPPPPPVAVAGWVEEIARAVGYAHERGVVHRDLKPTNVLVDEAGRVRVVDFGLARVQDGTRLTESLAAVGTPYYMSPEQILGDREIGPEADVWALGVLLYKGLAARYPFEGVNMVELGARIISGHVAPPSSEGVQVPSALEAVCLRCLQVERSERYPNGTALAEAILAALREPFLKSVRPRSLARALVWLIPLGLLGGLTWGNLNTPSKRFLAPPTVGAFHAALRAGDWPEANALAARASPRSVWEARLAAERKLSPPDLALQLQASGVPKGRAAQVAALCSARAAFLRGGRPHRALRAGRARWPLQSAWIVAEAEVLLADRRPREALDVLESLPETSAPEVLSWCATVRLRIALSDLLADPPRLEAWAKRPPHWRAGARGWLLREGLALVARLDRERERPYLPRSKTDFAPRARVLLRGAASLGDEGSRLEVAQALATLWPGEGELALPSAVEGTLGAAALRARARRALKDKAPLEALLLLGRIAPAPAQDLWEVALRAGRASDRLRGRALLASGDPVGALAPLQRSDPLSPGAAEDLVAAARAAQEEGLAERAAERLALLKGAKREESKARVGRIRGRYKHGRVPLAEISSAIALNPLYDIGHATYATSVLLRGDAGPEPVLLVGEAWPNHGSILHREVFSVWIEGLAMGHLKRDLLPGIRARAAPLSLAILDAISLEAQGAGAETALEILDRLESRLDDVPGAYAPRCARALLLLRAGRVGAAEADLAWLDAIEPNHGWARLIGTLLLARRGAPLDEVVDGFRAAGRGGLKTYRERAWSPQLYPELRLYLSPEGQRAGPLETFLRGAGWETSDGF